MSLVRIPPTRSTTSVAHSNDRCRRRATILQEGWSASARRPGTRHCGREQRTLFIQTPTAGKAGRMMPPCSSTDPVYRRCTPTTPRSTTLLRRHRQPRASLRPCSGEQPLGAPIHYFPVREQRPTKGFLVHACAADELRTGCASSINDALAQAAAGLIEDSGWRRRPRRLAPTLDVTGRHLHPRSSSGSICCSPVDYARRGDCCSPSASSPIPPCRSRHGDGERLRPGPASLNDLCARATT